MKLFKRIAVASAVILAVSFAGLQRLNYLSSKPINLDEFSWFNKVEIYGAYVVMNILGAPLYPEIAKEGLLMLLPSYKDQEVVFQSDFFLESAFIQDKILPLTDPEALFAELEAIKGINQSFAITPEMRNIAGRSGQRLWGTGGLVGLGLAARQQGNN